ncbi:hypothetical protein [Rhizobium sp. CC-YZS058]|uniref:DUF4376 domain-containing protein n=1 Tax=Rhizobium sp. CC-YZS058 TaxID=3042153 RepID=UPI002B059A7C|nr:hypothetical protein [Rhizobium sp. CC-YZS058]MEA3533736.1 DUF4376 domain-containing protein [Rhizobium sp. CC-YZS058]
MIYATFDQLGLPSGFFTEDMHGPRTLPLYGAPDESGEAPITGERSNPECLIPPAAIIISVAHWQEFLAYPNQRRWDGSKPVPYVPAAPIATADQVDAERERRIAEGFAFAGSLYQARPQDLRNINGAATGAALAFIAGAKSGDLRWANPAEDFAWIRADNTLAPMDAQTVIAFGKTAMAWVTAMTLAGRSIKDRLAAGEDFDITNPGLWPSSNL